MHFQRPCWLLAEETNASMRSEVTAAKEAEVRSVSTASFLICVNMYLNPKNQKKGKKNNSNLRTLKPQNPKTFKA